MRLSAFNVYPLIWVSKFWLNLISTHNFIRNHYLHHREIPHLSVLIRYPYDYNRCTSTDDHVRSPDDLHASIMSFDIDDDRIAALCHVIKLDLSCIALEPS
ncbi:hypothetical protein Droror1_Dr00000502 [Drosera rotundifolia]